MKYHGIEFRAVEPGTVVGHDANGHPMIVTSDTAIMGNGKAWVTQRMWDNLKAATKPQEAR